MKEINGNKIIVKGSGDDKLCILNMNTLEIIKTVSHPNMRGFDFCVLNDNSIITGGIAENCEIFKIG